MIIKKEMCTYLNVSFKTKQLNIFFVFNVLISFLSKAYKTGTIIHVCWFFFQVLFVALGCVNYQPIPWRNRKQDLTESAPSLSLGIVQGAADTGWEGLPPIPTPLHHEQQRPLYKFSGTLCVGWFSPWDS